MIEAIYLALRAGLGQGMATVFAASVAATVVGGLGVFALRPAGRNALKALLKRRERRQ